MIKMVVSMTKTQGTLLTEEGLEELKKEYDHLLNGKRPELVVRIAQAREAGDLAENSEYTAAREDLAFVDGRIAEIESILTSVKTIKHTKNVKTSKVDIGCKVHLNINGKEAMYTIVGEWEANPAEQKISHESPLGKALLGKEVGETVEVLAPAGKVAYQILTIE